MAETIHVTVRYFAGAGAAAGIPQEVVAFPSGTTTAEVVESVGTQHGEELTRVVKICSVLVNGVSDQDRSAILTSDTTLDLLPPFAGG